MPQIMDGHKLSEEIKNKVKKDVEKLKQCGIDVGLGLLQVGENLASRQYSLPRLLPLYFLNRFYG